MHPIPPPKLEEPVYEDFFPLGIVPPDVCPLHGPVADEDVTSNQRPRESAITVERVRRPDGTIAIIMRGGG